MSKRKLTRRFVVPLFQVHPDKMPERASKDVMFYLSLLGCYELHERPQRLLDLFDEAVKLDLGCNGR